MDLARTLNSVGKSTFVKYYHTFKNGQREECVRAFEEDFTEKAKRTRAGHAQRIFREGRQCEALEIIARSARVDPQTASRARALLAEENGTGR